SGQPKETTMERMNQPRRKGHLGLLAVTIALGFAVIPPSAWSEAPVRFVRLDGFAAPETPPELDKVGVLEIGKKNARNILILNPGTSASAAYFAPLAKTVVKQAKGWAVWAVERRENLLEDQSVLDRAKQGTAAPQEVFDYYLGWLANPSVTTHFQLIPDAHVAFARDWGMRVEIEDLRVVVNLAQKQAKRVVVGGHSLGGANTTAYATWDFDGGAGGAGPSGLVYIDRGSNPGALPPDVAAGGRRGSCGSRLHRRGKQPGSDPAGFGDGGVAGAADQLTVAQLRRHPGSVRRTLQLDRLARRDPRPQLAVPRPGLPVSSGDPQAP